MGRPLHELIAEDENIAVAAVKRQIAEEDAAWRALPEEERDRICAERDAKWQAFFDTLVPPVEDEEDE